MKVKVLKLFSDGNRLYYENEIVDITNERVEYFNSSSNGLLVKVIKGEVIKEVKTMPTKSELEKINKKKLVEIADERGIRLDTNMTKAEMIKELV